MNTSPMSNRPRADHLPCPTCGYDLRAIIEERGYEGMGTGARCPECGESSDLWSMYRTAQRGDESRNGLLRFIGFMLIINAPHLFASALFALFDGHGWWPAVRLITVLIGVVYLLPLSWLFAATVGETPRSTGLLTAGIWLALMLWNLIWVGIVSGRAFW